MQVPQKITWALVLWACLTLPLTAAADEPAKTVQEAPPQVEQAVDPGITGNQGAPKKEETFTRVELDTFIELEKHAAEKGKKLIKMAKPVSFDARMKRFPEEREVSYVYTALELSGVSPMPEIKHRMFVESSGGRIIPVYVEKNAVAKLNTGLKEEDKAHFLGYHVYSYSKGPAILVVDFSAIP